MNKYNRKEKGEMALGKYSLLGLCQELVGISKAQGLQRLLHKTEVVQSVCSLLFL